ncbi:MAG: hypothetical protein WCI79_01820 [Candidatus Saccharibacteria bacterium]
MKVQIVSGNIAEVPADVLITRLDSSSQGFAGNWHDNVSKAIIRTSGTKFHDQLADVDGTLLLAFGDDSQSCVYRNVLFVLEESSENLYDMVIRVLKEADENKMSSASLPAFFTSNFYDDHDVRINESLLSELHRAVVDFTASKPQNLKELFLVIYENVKSFQFLTDMLS